MEHIEKPTTSGATAQPDACTQPDFDLDPRSPSYGIPRTPLTSILKSRPDVMRSEADLAKILDPRSPTIGIARTPLNVNSKVALKECDSPSEYMNADDVTTLCDKKILDPRSPTADFDRTPLQFGGYVKKAMTKRVELDENMLKDPRSPVQDFVRTPLPEQVSCKAGHSDTSVADVVRVIDFQSSIDTSTSGESSSTDHESSPDVSLTSALDKLSVKSMGIDGSGDAPSHSGNIDERFATPCAKPGLAKKEECKQLDFKPHFVHGSSDISQAVDGNKKRKSYIFADQSEKFSTPKNVAQLRFSQKFSSASPNRSPLSVLGSRNSPKVENKRTSLELKGGLRMRKGLSQNPNVNSPLARNIHSVNKEN